MQTEIFQTKREFNKKFPSKLYICCNCGTLTNDKYICPKCGWLAYGLFQTDNKGYKYTILEENLTEEIFKPIEILKGELQNDNE